MQIEKVAINKIKGNKANPRIIKDHKFHKLVKSLREFPEMLQLRPIVVDETMTILGGNMRYKASIEAGLKEVWVLKAEDLTEEQEKEFIVKDNVGFGEWDWDVLANGWDTKLLTDWGMDVWKNADDFTFEIDEENETKTEDKTKISDDGYSSFELIMLHENKVKLISALSKIKKDKFLDKMEDALMTLITNKQ